MKIPAAKAAVDKEWQKLEKISAWNLTKVKSKKEVFDEARISGAKVHFASLMDICHLKNAEWEAKHQKCKGRVVLRGDVVKNNSGSYGVFVEQGSLPFWLKPFLFKTALLARVRLLHFGVVVQLSATTVHGTQPEVGFGGQFVRGRLANCFEGPRPFASMASCVEPVCCQVSQKFPSPAPKKGKGKGQPRSPQSVQRQSVCAPPHLRHASKPPEKKRQQTQSRRSRG